MSRIPFTASDLEAIGQATTAAEARTAGEIVPYLVQRVDDHEESRWRWTALGSVVAAAAAGVAHQITNWWGVGIWWISAPAILGAFAGLLLGRIPVLERLLLDRNAVEQRVRLRAEAAFLEEEVFRTRDRTGILLLVAFFEHRAVLLADEGIHRAVAPGVWDDVVAKLVARLRAGQAKDGIIEAIERCGEILETHVARRDDDTDELADAPRLRDR